MRVRYRGGGYSVMLSPPTCARSRRLDLGRQRTVLGGDDAGPAPYNLLVAALAACTSITLRMYADRKGWELGPVHVDVTFLREQDVERIERTIKLAPTLTAEQRTRLAEIAEKTPVTKTLKRSIAITTVLV